MYQFIIFSSMSRAGWCMAMGQERGELNELDLKPEAVCV